MGESGTGQQEYSGRVLVVDDSRLVRAMIGRTLLHAGYAVAEAADGKAALALLSKDDFDVVITDLRMPEMDGFAVLSTVKRLSPLVEVIILTGTHAQDMNSAVRALRLGAHDYLTKPAGRPEEVIMTVERAVEKKRLKESNLRLLRELEQQSRTDALTGLANRRALEATLPQEIARSRRHGHALGTVVLDLDHFKKINDTLGHLGGDEVLRALGGIVRATLREGDTAYRYGGEEFVVLLPHTDLRGALRAAERLVAAVAGSTIHAGSRNIGVTVSAGVACLGDADRDGSAFLARADSALYTAKNSGRNRAHADGAHLALVAAS